VLPLEVVPAAAAALPVARVGLLLLLLPGL
jgi:hypothetical protein